MFYGVVFIRAALLVAGILWCGHIIKRLPDDISELRLSYQKYKTRRDPDVVDKMKEDQRLRYQDDCATEFWTTIAVQVLLFWPITAVVLFFVVTFIIFGVILPVLQVF